MCLSPFWISIDNSSRGMIRNHWLYVFSEWFYTARIMRCVAQRKSKYSKYKIFDRSSLKDLKLQRSPNWRKIMRKNFFIIYASTWCMINRILPSSKLSSGDLFFIFYWRWKAKQHQQHSPVAYVQSKYSHTHSTMLSHLSLYRKERETVCEKDTMNQNKIRLLNWLLNDFRCSQRSLLVAYHNLGVH